MEIPNYQPKIYTDEVIPPPDRVALRISKEENINPELYYDEQMGEITVILKEGSKRFNERAFRTIGKRALEEGWVPINRRQIQENGIMVLITSLIQFSSETN